MWKNSLIIPFLTIREILVRIFYIDYHDLGWASKKLDFLGDMSPTRIVGVDPPPAKKKQTKSSN